MSPRHHHRKGEEPSVRLGLASDPFTLFYDYDELDDGKLGALSAKEKSIWLRRRIDMVFIEPLRRIFKEEEFFDRLLRTQSDRTVQSCFSIAIMSIMLSGVEALGSFMKPELAERDRPPNQELFYTFIRKYMSDWNKPAPILEATVPEILWRYFRVGITHGFQIKPRGSLEFLEHDRFLVDRGLFQVCPEHFFDDLVVGVNQYFNNLTSSSAALEQFHKRFLMVYPVR